MKNVYCIKLKKEAPGLARTPYPGELGRKILENVSAEAWRLWLNHQTMLINENNLNMMDDKAQQYLKNQLEKFFFSEDNLDEIAGWTPLKK